MPRGIKKENLPTKLCVTCKKPFTWRKKWERCWDEVTTCSKRCNAARRTERKSKVSAVCSTGGECGKREQSEKRRKINPILGNLRGGSKIGRPLQVNGAQKQTFSTSVALLVFSELVRYELFYKSTEDLIRQTALYANQYGFHRLNLPNKRKNDPVLHWCQAVLKENPKADVIPHWSLKNQYAGSPEKTFQRFGKFCQSVHGYGVRECLLISGGGKKRKSDLSTLHCLRMAQRRKQSPVRTMKIGVAFNPFFPEIGDFKAEKKCLRGKLETGLVSSVWVQIGSDPERLREGLQFLVEECKRLELEEVIFYGSILIPSNTILNQMRFRPWNGVFLSEEYLSSTENANKITMKVIEVLASFGVRILVESRLGRQEDAQTMGELLSSHTKASNICEEIKE
mmetsp:Transcript_2008/g.2860  ORF Transcript_2008/g.2860 Transcript_2008/m.2860 type:complete len:397 (+) Transcript_2008:79-1269(+)